MHIVGTAGHVDHGKSSLVQALTGTNPDRWKEERERGMTLDLGFAHLRFPDGVEAGVVDVPGHERFLHNMLAGAAGMDLLLLVVDLVEGIMPQTVEHLQILQFLNVRSVLVAATKADLLPPAGVEPACEALHESLRDSIAADARVIAVSAVTGSNLDVLKKAIHDSLAQLPPRDANAPAYLPIDRAFALPGHGTIVTGTLMQGAIAAGDTLTLQPSGKSVRVRGVQTFHEKRERVLAGSRAAINVPSVAATEIARGEVLGAPQFVPSNAFDVQFTPVAGALPILKRRNAVRAYVGSAEILGTLVLPQIPATCERVHAQLFLQTPVAAPPHSAFVVRRLSPKDLLGGGRLSAAGTADDVTPQSDPVSDRVAAALERSARVVSTPAELAADLNLLEARVEEVLQSLAERGEVIAVARPLAYAANAPARTLLESIAAELRARQEAEPWAMGQTSLALSRTLNLPETVLARLLQAFARDGLLAHRAGYFSTPEFVPELTAPQRTFFDELLAGDPAAPFVPIALSAAVTGVKQSRVPGAGKAFDMLIAKGALVKVNDDLYKGQQIAAIRARVETFLRANERMTMAQFRDLIGTSRKYAVPLLEWFDARGITVRSGDFRMLRGRA
ncbi:MAG TPA: selenocysteine-specific translation elongation factor [Candidatus Baltobacteraceae bacterium]|nr:selenocysteine-specific translation elongation factor [Candidatus Baltobacteraceae bacterium]